MSPKGFYDRPACEIRAECLTDWEREEMQFELQESIAQEQADTLLTERKSHGRISPVQNQNN